MQKRSQIPNQSTWMRRTAEIENEPQRSVVNCKQSGHVDARNHAGASKIKWALQMKWAMSPPSHRMLESKFQTNKVLQICITLMLKAQDDVKSHPHKFISYVALSYILCSIVLRSCMACDLFLSSWLHVVVRMRFPRLLHDNRTYSVDALSINRRRRHSP